MKIKLGKCWGTEVIRLSDILRFLEFQLPNIVVFG